MAADALGEELVQVCHAGGLHMTAAWRQQQQQQQLNNADAGVALSEALEVVVVAERYMRRQCGSLEAQLYSRQLVVALMLIMGIS